MQFMWEAGIIFLMLLFNAVFAAYEMALASVSRSRLAALVAAKKKGAAESLFMKDRMEASLAVVQLGITLVGACAAAVGGAGVGDALKPVLVTQWHLSPLLAEILAIIALVIPLSFLTIIFAELVPKMIALNNQEGVVTLLSPWMKKMATMTSPLISVFEWSVKAIVGFFSARKKSSADVGDEKAQSLVELKAAAALARASRLISAREEKIVTSAAMMTTRAVREIILPASEIATIKRESTIMDAFVKAHLDMHTRFPVCATEGDPQSIIGYVNFKDILVAMKMSPHDTGIKGIVRPIKIIDGAKQISVVLEQLIQEKAHITLVADKEGKILGMVTLEDILEELVGEIEDEFDRLPTYVHSYGSSWLMGGGVSMTTVASTLGVTFMPDHPHKVPTLSEWCIAKSGGSLVGGDVMEKDGILVVFRKLRRKRLVEAVVSLPKKRG